MAKKSTLYYIYNDLVEAMNPIVGDKNIFLKNRPKIADGDVPMKKFIVIDLPISIRDYVIGNRKTYLTTRGVFYLFTQARKNDTLDINAMGDLVDGVVDLFPISGDYVVATNPVVQMTGSDKAGFQVTTVTFDLRSKWGAFEK